MVNLAPWTPRGAQGKGIAKLNAVKPGNDRWNVGPGGS